MTDLTATADLVAAVRHLMTAAATSDLPPDDLLEVSARLDELTERLRGRARPGTVREHLDAEAIERVRSGEVWSLWKHNPLALPLDITVEGGIASSDLVPGPLLEGPPGLMHGGFSAALLDSLLATLAQVQGRRVVTVRLDVSYRAAIPLGIPVRLVGEITGTQGRKTTAVGEIRLPSTDPSTDPAADEVVAVRATALLLEIPGDPN